MTNPYQNLPDGVEGRAFAEFRAADDDGSVVEGHAATFNEPYDVGPFREQIAPGAFEDVLEDDVRALVNHNPDKLLGRTTSGTLKVGTDDVGLTARIELPDTSDGRDVRELVQRGDLDQMSFGFEVAEDSWEELEDGSELRTIEEVKALWDVSAVTYPANPDTSLALRSREQWKQAREEDEPEETREEGLTVKVGVDISEVERARSAIRQVRDEIEGRQSRPEFDGTEDTEPEWADGAWGRPDLSDHPEASGDEEWDDLPSESRAAIAARFIVGTAESDTYGELSYPVVNPATDRLNRNGLLAARQRASAEGDTEVSEIADALWEEFYAEEENNGIHWTEAALMIEEASLEDV